MFALAFRFAIAAVIGLAALLKLVRAEGAAAAFGGLGLPGGRRLVVAVAAVELALAAGVAAGLDVAAYAAAALMLGFALVLLRAVRSGRGGAPCPCFGAGGRVGWPAVARNVLLAAAFLAVPFIGRLETTELMAAGLVLALVGVIGLGVAVLALARELGELRLHLPPDVALEIGSEGPEIGERTRLVDRFVLPPGARFALAVFTSEGCRLCAALSPAIEALARDPLVALEVFDEVADADVWRALAVPGSPYAVALDRDGGVRAKGTFNTLGQLESILAAAERRGSVHA